MNRKKKLFIIFAVIFLVVMLYVSYDISRKTTFPGSDAQLKERLLRNNQEQKKDSVVNSDSLGR